MMGRKNSYIAERARTRSYSHTQSAAKRFLTMLKMQPRTDQLRAKCEHAS